MLLEFTGTTVVPFEGSIMIFAPDINNQGGIIQAPDGQVILAAGAKAYLAINPDQNDITLRGSFALR